MPCAEDGDISGRVFAWHAYQGAILTRWSDFEKNAFHLCWMPVSDGAPGQWIAVDERLPTEEDADAQNCVLSMDTHGDIRTTEFRQFGRNADLLRWQRLPAPPDGIRKRE